MKVKPPMVRRKFCDIWDEIGYLYDKLLYWLYEKADKHKSLPFARRLELLLRKEAPQHEGIFGEECWSLVYETKGDLPKAIKYRENMIRLIRRLHEISRDKPYEDTVIKLYAPADLSDQLDLLAILYHDNGKLDKAILTLHESKRYCEKHGIKFDGADILDEYLEEKKESQGEKYRTGTYA